MWRPTPSPLAPSPLSAAVWICLLAALAYLLTYAGTLHAVDEQSALSVAESALLGQGFHVNQMEWDQARTPPQNAFGRDGNLYSKKGLGVSLLALPLFGLGELLAAPVGAVQLALLAGTLATLMSVWAMFWLARSLGYGLATAGLAAGLLAFGSPLWPYARTLFSEAPGATGLALALWGMGAWRRRRHTPWLVLAGSGLALLILVKSSNGVVVPFFGFYWLWGVAKGRHTASSRSVAGEFASLGTPVLLAVGATVAYNYTRFGTTLGFPLESFETFSTPLLVGLGGLLFSPGKGIFWYFPPLWLGVISAPRWRMGGRLPDFLLAAGSALAIVLVYALWYDWPGGRAWGPRMIITAMPALAMLVLPALDWLVSRQAPAASRALAAAWLLLSVAVQIPGVLVNFERQEELDMQAGATFEQLLWSPGFSPLLTYWQRIGATPDPLLLQPYLRAYFVGGLPLPAWTLAAALAAAALVALLLAARQLLQHKPARLWLGLGGLSLVLLALLLPLLAYTDPRWDDQSAVREDNREIRRSVQEDWQADDMVLIDLLESSDMGRRTAQWLNFARREPYIGWLRKESMEDGTGEQLATWLAPYRRVWLLLQATDENDSTSTTEAWLDERAYAGRRWWVGDQRVVEYLLPPAQGDPGEPGSRAVRTVEVAGPFRFGPDVVLSGYRLAAEEASGARWLDLQWRATGGADTRYSVQALGGEGVLLQVDGMPGSGGEKATGEKEDRIGLRLPAATEHLILKVYRAGDGSVAEVVGPGERTAASYLVLASP